MVSATNHIPLYILVRFCNTFFVQKWISPFIYWVKKFLKDTEPPVLFLLVKGSHQVKKFVCVLARGTLTLVSVSSFLFFSLIGGVGGRFSFVILSSLSDVAISVAVCVSSMGTDPKGVEAFEVVRLGAFFSLNPRRIHRRFPFFPITLCRLPKRTPLYGLMRLFEDFYLERTEKGV